MRYIILLFLTSSLALSQPMTFEDTAFLESISQFRKDLAGYWRLEETDLTRYDSSWHGNHLTPYISPGGLPAKVGNGVFLIRSSSKYLSCSSNSSLQTGGKSFWVSAWIQQSSQGTAQTVASKWNATTDEWIFQITTGNKVGFYISSDGSTVAKSVTSDAFGAISAGQFYFVEGWLDVVNQQLGVAVNLVSNVVSTASQTVSRNEIFCIGANGSLSQYFDGYVDEFGYWMRQRTAADAVKLYNSGHGVTFPRFQSFDTLPVNIHVASQSDVNTLRPSITNTLFSSNSLPTEIGILYTTNSPSLGLTNLASTQAILMTSYTARPRVWTPASGANGKVMLIGQGHGAGYNVANFNVAIQTYLNAGITVCGFVMPGGDEITSGTSANHVSTTPALHNFIGPAIIAINTLTNNGYSQVYASGLSGGGWASTLLSAIDTRVLKSYPEAGTLPLFCNLQSPTDRDWEQLLPTISPGNLSYLDLYLMSSDSGRRQKQILHTLDACCFSLAHYNTGQDYAQRVANIASSMGGSYELLWKSQTLHQFEAQTIIDDILPEL